MKKTTSIQEKKIDNKGNIKMILVIILIALWTSALTAQEISKEEIRNHSFILKTQFFQFKDDFNYGLSYKGINLIAAYSFTKESNRKEFSYNVEIGFGGSFNKGAGLAWRFKPLDLFYGKKLSSSRLTIGGYIAADYQWQQYSELQGGRLFWFNSIEIGPKMRYNLPFNSKFIEISLSNSIAGLAARPEPVTEEYYYDFSFSEFLSTAHDNLTLGSSNLFNRTILGIKLKGQEKKRFTIGYQFEYFGYYKDPNLTFLNHSLNFIFNI